MAIVLKELISKLTDIDISILAGHEGMVNPVMWIHLVEGEEIADFIEFGEVVFTTGIALNEERTLLRLVKTIYSKKASGIIVNIGPYINTIPEEVIAFCDKEKFPLMLVPWKVSMSKILRSMTFEITNKNLRDMDFEIALKNAILYPAEEKTYRKPLEKQNLDVGGEFSCIVLNAEYEMQPLKEIQLNKIIYQLKNKMGYMYQNIYITIIFNSVVIVISESTKEQVDKVVASCQSLMQMTEIQVDYIGYLVGNQVKGVENLYISYENALKLLRVKNCYDPKKQIMKYEEMGIYKLLMELENKSVIYQYYDETVRAIVEYDTYNASDLLLVLDKYLKHNGSLKKVAEELFLHRNTVNYKLGKIESLTNCNISSQEGRMKLALGIAIYKMYKENLSVKS